MVAGTPKVPVSDIRGVLASCILHQLPWLISSDEFEILMEVKLCLNGCLWSESRLAAWLLQLWVSMLSVIYRRLKHRASLLKKVCCLTYSIVWWKQLQVARSLRGTQIQGVPNQLLASLFFCPWAKHVMFSIISNSKSRFYTVITSLTVRWAC